jgi:hypothetical protein
MSRIRWRSEVSGLPKPPDSVTLTLLTRARQFLTHALSHSHGISSLDRMVTIHGLDSSIENLLRITVRHLDIETAAGKNLDSTELSNLAGEVNRFLKEEHDFVLPYLSEIKDIRKIRNLVQHGMVDAGPDILRFRTITERFFDKLLMGIFGIGREEIRVSSVVENTEVKGHLAIAEQKMDEDDFLMSVVSSRNAFESAVFEKAGNFSFRLFALPVLLKASVDEKDSYWFYSYMLDEIKLLRLGLDMNRYGRFLDYLRNIPKEYRVEGESGGVIMQRPWERDDAHFCYSFVSEAVLKWQNEAIPPLYDLSEFVSKHVRRVIIGGVELSEGLGSQSVHFLNEGEMIEEFYADTATKDNFERLAINEEYEYLVEVYRDKTLGSRSKYKVQVRAKATRLATHEPERWQCAIWHLGLSDATNDLSSSR